MVQQEGLLTLSDSSKETVDYKSLTYNDNINPKYLNAAKVFSKDTIDAANKWAEFWYYKDGRNTIPADTRHKEAKVLLRWNSGDILYQTNPIPPEIFEKWKELGLFGFGIANVCGIRWRGSHKSKYVNVIDYDNLLALEEICLALGITKEELYQLTLVEEHKDEPGSGHIYVASSQSFPKKPSNKTSKDPELIRKLENNEIPSLEVKPDGLIFCCNSTHENGEQYRIKGTSNIWNNDNFYLCIDTVCKKYPPLQYLDDDNRVIPQQSTEELFQPDHFVRPNQNRSLDLLRMADSIIRRNKKIFSKQRLHEMVEIVHKEHHSPYPVSKVNATFEQAWNKVEEWEKEEAKLNEYVDKIIEESTTVVEPPIQVIPSSPAEVVEKNDNLADLSQTSKAKGLTEEAYDNNNHHTENIPEQTPVYEDKLVIPNQDYVEYIIDIVKKTVRQEDALVRQILYTVVSKDTTDPLNLAIMAPTSEGKTYAVMETVEAFQSIDIWSIGKMSPKAIIRLHGTLVDKNNEPIGHIVKKIKKGMAVLGNGKKDRIKKAELHEKLEEITEGSKTLIDLTGKCLIFLEPPETEFWNIVKPILSHDKNEIEYPFVDTHDSIITKNIVVRGFPSCIFCSAKDESRWPQWSEIVSRFMITSPNMIKKKYEESNILLFQQKGLPEVVRQKLVVSNEEKALVKQCVEAIKGQIKKYNNVWIPYGNLLAQWLPSDKGTDVRAAKRIRSLLSIIPLIKSNLRYNMQFEGEDQGRLRSSSRRWYNQHQFNQVNLRKRFYLYY